MRVQYVKWFGVWRRVHANGWVHLRSEVPEEEVQCAVQNGAHIEVYPQGEKAGV